MTYFNRSFVLKERHVEHFNFPHLFTNESTVNEVTEGLKLNLHEIVRNAFDISCQYTEGFIPNMLEIDTINIDFNYVTDEKKYGPIDSIIRKFTSKEKQYYSLRFEIEYEVYLKENIDRNYLKLKDHDLYNRIYSDEFNALMYINFYTLFGDHLYKWSSENEISMSHGLTI